MSVIDIRVVPDPVLRKIAKPVENIDDDIVKLSTDMIETMILAHGAGLAANQVGLPIELIVIDASLNPREKEHIVLINPVIVEKELEENAEEGCLSVPGYYEYVKRAKRVLARGTDIRGNTIEFDCEGQLARALQHETDHLRGVLFIDILSPLKKALFKKKYSRKNT
ncbi:MAG: peptide deformylase [Syntrophorhabdaceae bacterium]|nr:peptide deformylase [Syntrophorhabdaceae bacterium]MDD4195294.1 peptide deformylase [Syntrophorhabdaceae bacterium]